MAKLRKCDDCACRGICKIEDDYRTISKNMDQVYNSYSKDSYFSMPELICYRYIHGQLNNLITEANKNGRVER